MPAAKRDGALDRPADPADLVQYQPGAVVSRTLVTNSGGSITVFAFAAGERLNEHSTPHDAILHVLDGQARVRVGSIEHEVQEGQAVALPANVPHAVDSDGRFKMLLTMLRSPT